MYYRWKWSGNQPSCVVKFQDHAAALDVLMRDQLCYVLLQQAALKTHLAVATHLSVTLQRHILMRPYVMRAVAYVMPDSVPHLSVSSMVWKHVHVQPRKNFVICVVKRKGEHVLRQCGCHRYKVDDWKKGIVLCFIVSVFLHVIRFHISPHKLYHLQYQSAPCLNVNWALLQFPLLLYIEMVSIIFAVLFLLMKVLLSKTTAAKWTAIFEAGSWDTMR